MSNALDNSMQFQINEQNSSSNGIGGAMMDEIVCHLNGSHWMEIEIFAFETCIKCPFKSHDGAWAMALIL